MNTEVFRAILAERKRIAQETQDEWIPGIEKCWKQEVEILCENMPATVDYLQGECTADEFVWISEVCYEVAEKTRSKDFVNALRELSLKYPEETNRYNIDFFIDSAEAVLDEATQRN